MNDATDNAMNNAADNAADNAMNNAATKTAAGISGYGDAATGAAVSVDALNESIGALSLTPPTYDEVCALVKSTDNKPHISVRSLTAGYGKFEILHEMPLAVGRGQSLCLIGPNGAGKSTVLHAIYGFSDIHRGNILLGDADISKQSPLEKLRHHGIAYILQDSSIFPNMTVEENLLLGGYVLSKEQAQEQTERVLAKYDRLRARAKQPASTLSGGERRLLEVSRALITQPSILLVDEPSIGLEPRFIDMVFEILADLQHTDGKTIIMVEQNAKKGLHFADIGYVLTAGTLLMAARGDELLANPDVGRLFLGE